MCVSTIVYLFNIQAEQICFRILLVRIVCIIFQYTFKFIMYNYQLCNYVIIINECPVKTVSRKCGNSVPTGT